MNANNKLEMENSVVLLTLNMKITVCWDVTACSLVQNYYVLEKCTTYTFSCFYPGDGDRRFLQNGGKFLPVHTVLHPSGGSCLTQSSNFLLTVHAPCHPTLQHHNSYNRTDKHRQWNEVWPPDDGRKDARNMLRDYWLPIKSLIVASSWSHIYLFIKDARSFEHKV